jgi:EAL domain-containing protein (putative c-di-GMP-specific phosphodiesterase class I)
MGELSVTHVSRPVVRRVTKIGILTAAPCAVERAHSAQTYSIISLSSRLRAASFAASRRCFAGTTLSAAWWLPLAEEIGLIVPIGEWVLHQACAEAAAWPDDLKVAVNLSPVQFKKGNLPQMVFATLASAGLPAARLELEITESILLAESKANLATLRRLRALGVGISMDDFGTGYSGLSYLRAFPCDKIKIDRSFISELSESADCMAIIKAITNLGSNLGIPTLAEGVETKKQLAWLREAGCTEMQGYLFSRPVPASEIAGLLSPHRNCRQADQYLLSA